MAFTNIIKLNSIVAEGFLMNEIISLFEKSDYKLNEIEEIRLLNDALNYISMVKKGKIFMSDQRPVDNLKDSLEAYSTTLNALNEAEENLTNERFNEIIDLSEKQITETIEKKKISIEKLQIANFLFNSIRTNLLKKANTISRKEKNIFNPL